MLDKNCNHIRHKFSLSVLCMASVLSIMSFGLSGCSDSSGGDSGAGGASNTFALSKSELDLSSPVKNSVLSSRAILGQAAQPQAQASFEISYNGVLPTISPLNGVTPAVVVSPTKSAACTPASGFAKCQMYAVSYTPSNTQDDVDAKYKVQQAGSSDQILEVKAKVSEIPANQLEIMGLESPSDFPLAAFKTKDEVPSMPFEYVTSHYFPVMIRQKDISMQYKPADLTNVHLMLPGGEGHNSHNNIASCSSDQLQKGCALYQKNKDNNNQYMPLDNGEVTLDNYGQADGVVKLVFPAKLEGDKYSEINFTPVLTRNITLTSSSGQVYFRPTHDVNQLVAQGGKDLPQTAWHNLYNTAQYKQISSLKCVPNTAADVFPDYFNYQSEDGSFHTLWIGTLDLNSGGTAFMSCANKGTILYSSNLTSQRGVYVIGDTSQEQFDPKMISAVASSNYMTDNGITHTVLYKNNNQPSYGLVLAPDMYISHDKQYINTRSFFNNTLKLHTDGLHNPHVLVLSQRTGSGVRYYPVVTADTDSSAKEGAKLFIAHLTTKDDLIFEPIALPQDANITKWIVMDDHVYQNEASGDSIKLQHILVGVGDHKLYLYRSSDIIDNGDQQKIDFQPSSVSYDIPPALQSEMSKVDRIECQDIALNTNGKSNLGQRLCYFYGDNHADDTTTTLNDYTVNLVQGFDPDAANQIDKKTKKVIPPSMHVLLSSTPGQAKTPSFYQKGIKQLMVDPTSANWFLRDGVGNIFLIQTGGAQPQSNLDLDNYPHLKLNLPADTDTSQVVGIGIS